MPSCARSTGPSSSLVPGFPLTHPDHAWLVRTLADLSGLGRGSIALGVYARAAVHAPRGTEPNVPAGSQLVRPAVFEPVAVGLRRPHREVARDPPLRLAAPAPRDARKPAARPSSLRGRFRVDRLGAGLTSTSA